MKTLLLVSLLFVVSFARADDKIRCQQATAISGNMFTCLSMTRKGAVSHTVNLYKIVTPQSGQAYAAEAKAYLDSLLNKDNSVTVDVNKRITSELVNGEADRGCDPPSILLGICLPPNISYLMLQNGFARVHPVYRSGSARDQAYLAAEQEAKKAKRGMWADLPE